MDKKERTNWIAVAVIGGIFLLVVGYVVKRTFDQATRSADQSTVMALAGFLFDHSGKLETTRTRSGPRWRRLTDSEYDRLIGEIYRMKNFAPDRKGWKPGQVLYDHWGRRYRVAVRRTAEGKEDFFVWSTGPDGKTGTKDDVTFMYDLPVPKELVGIGQDEF